MFRVRVADTDTRINTSSFTLTPILTITLNPTPMQGDRFWHHFHSDSSNTEWGYRIEVEAELPKPCLPNPTNIRDMSTVVIVPKSVIQKSPACVSWTSDGVVTLCGRAYPAEDKFMFEDRDSLGY